MTATLSEAPASVTLAHKDLISDQLWKRLTGRLVKENEGMDLALAERIMDQTLAFLSLSATTTGTSYSPSPLVDKGWHTFIVYTKPYAEFCQQTAGHFIHHNPFDEDGVEYGTGQVARTAAAMVAAGFQVDMELWVGDRDCGDTGCVSSCDDDK